jgi:hypothetical protein
MFGLQKKLKIANFYTPFFVEESVTEEVVRREQQRLTWFECF